MAIQGAHAKIGPCGDLTHLQLQPTFGKNGLRHLENTRSIGHGIGAFGRSSRMVHALLLSLATGETQEGLLSVEYETEFRFIL
jgi:hypothetical protein